MRHSALPPASFRKLVVSVAAALPLVIGAVGCSSNDSTATTTPSQIAVRDSAAAATCDKAASCGDIGAGKTYETRNQCDTRQQAAWDTLLPPRTCDGHIDTAQYDICLSSIRASECGNAADLVNILANKCPAAKVCGK